MLSAANVLCANVHTLYGHFDFLVRMWGTTGKRERFLAQLEDRDASVDEVKEFQVRNTRFLWTDDLPNETLLPEEAAYVEGKVKEYYKAAGIGDSQSARTILQDLEQRRLLLRMPAFEPASDVAANNNRPVVQKVYKVYLALGRIPGSRRAAPEFEIRELSSFLRKLQASRTIQQVSLYQGIGFADYLIKCIVGNFYDIWTFNAEIVQQVSGFNLRPETYIVATLDEGERDFVDAEWKEPDPDEHNLLEALRPEIAVNATKIPQDLRTRMAELFRTYNPRFQRDGRSTPFRQIFLDLFTAVISKDLKPLAAAVLMMHELEGQMGQLFRKAWAECYPDELEKRSKMNDAAKQVNMNAFAIEKAGLKEWADVSAKDKAVHEVVDRLMLEKMGRPEPAWNEKLRNLAKFRNDFAHGTAFREPRYLETNWDELAKVLCEVGTIYDELNSSSHNV